MPKDKRPVAVRPAAAPVATGSSIRFSAEPGVGFEMRRSARAISRERGFLKTLPEKTKQNPGVLRFLGAADIKPFAFVRYLANTRWNKQNTERVAVNFKDFYQDAPSWNESYIMKNPDGTPTPRTTPSLRVIR